MKLTDDEVAFVTTWRDSLAKETKDIRVALDRAEGSPQPLPRRPAARAPGWRGLGG